MWLLQNKGHLALIEICRARLATNPGATQRRGRVSHGSFLESDSYYRPLHRDRPGSAQERSVLLTKISTVSQRDAGLQETGCLNLQCTGGRHTCTIWGAAGKGVAQPITTSPYPRWRGSLQGVFIEVLGGGSGF